MKTEYIEKLTKEARLKGLPDSFEILDNALKNYHWRVICSNCDERVAVGSAPYPQTKAEHTRLARHLKNCKSPRA
jgi:hypothetical protein